MFGHKGHKWEPAEGTVVEFSYDHQSRARSPNEERVYIVDVRQPSGTTKRTDIRALSSMRAELAPGTVVRLEVSSKTGEIRFDQHHPVAHSPSSHARRPPSGQAPGQRTGVTPGTLVTGVQASGSAGGTIGSAGDSFGGAFGQDDKAERIARLEQQRIRGQVTEQQFAEQRQRILDEF